MKPPDNDKTRNFLARFGKVERNTNCLTDIACPHCGCRDHFHIQVTTVVGVFDNGTDSQEGDNEWDEDSFCRCMGCKAEGKLRDFTFSGLDEALEDYAIQG